MDPPMTYVAHLGGEGVHVFIWVGGVPSNVLLLRKSKQHFEKGEFQSKLILFKQAKCELTRRLLI